MHKMYNYSIFQTLISNIKLKSESFNQKLKNEFL